jgi:hypothetical protein
MMMKKGKKMGANVQLLGCDLRVGFYVKRGVSEGVAGRVGLREALGF